MQEKINSRFGFPEELDLKEFTKVGLGVPDEYYKYELSGVVIHSGEINFGHYYTWIKH